MLSKIPKQQCFYMLVKWPKVSYSASFAEQRALNRDGLVNSGQKCIMNPWCCVLYLENHNYPSGKPLSNFIFYPETRFA